MTKLTNFISAPVPLFAVVFLAGACYYAGAQLGNKNNGKYVTADKSTVILNAVLDLHNAGSSEEEMKTKIVAPVLGVLKKYADQGYVVVETGKDERGNMLIAALPADTRDITNELAEAVKTKNDVSKP